MEKVRDLYISKDRKYNFFTWKYVSTVLEFPVVVFIKNPFSDNFLLSQVWFETRTLLDSSL